MKIYHVVLPADWESRAPDDDYQAASLRSEGFIHCSYSHQLGSVLERYYRDAGRVLILEIETDRLSSKLVPEPSTNREIYPHIYGPINSDAIVRTIERELPVTGE